jgi:hypothetical protein
MAFQVHFINIAGQIGTFEVKVEYLGITTSDKENNLRNL